MTLDSPDRLDNIKRLKLVIAQALETDLLRQAATPAEVGAALATATVHVMEEIIERSEVENVERNRNACLMALQRMAAIVATTRPDVGPERIH